MAIFVWVGTLAGERFALVSGVRTTIVLVCLPLVVASIHRHGWQLRPSVLALCVVCGVVGGAHSWHKAATPVSGECSGVAVIRVDPERAGRGTATVLELDHRRYRVIAHGIAGRRLGARLVGETVHVRGYCRPTEGPFSRFDRITHVVGRMNIEEVSESFGEGSAVMRAANRMRRSLVDGVQSMPYELRALFTGLVIGDDREQPRQMISDFRASGLSHVCAVSGQNVAYLLAMLAPFLSRLGRGARWWVTLFVIAWFVVLTRGEPSVLRAAVMAGLVATNAAIGTSMNSRSILSCTVMVLLVVDPMLAWSVGFALSVGATAGLAWVSAWLGKVVGGRGVVAATLAAQVGTTPIQLLVFGYVPVVSVIANPLAVGVSGAVMMFGLPLALVSSLIPAIEPAMSALMSLPVAWVAWVARVSAAVAPTGLINVVLWVCVPVIIWGVHRRRARRLSAVAG